MINARSEDSCGYTLALLLAQQIIEASSKGISCDARYGNEKLTCRVSFNSGQNRKTFAEVHGEVIGLVALDSSMPITVEVEEARNFLENRSEFCEGLQFDPPCL